MLQKYHARNALKPKHIPLAVHAWRMSEFYVGKPNKRHSVADITLFAERFRIKPCGESGTMEHKSQKLLDVGKGST